MGLTVAICALIASVFHLHVPASSRLLEVAEIISELPVSSIHSAY